VPAAPCRAEALIRPGCLPSRATSGSVIGVARPPPARSAPVFRFSIEARVGLHDCWSARRSRSEVADHLSSVREVDSVSSR
jgi:hypothetical protein